ncbi:MAG TPA: glycosyltransferase, partial [Chitinophagales bacterium]|nr:glycosyltransferase [Chitinophagales bacterium]
ESNNTQLIWQTGSYYYNKIVEKWKEKTPKGIQIHQFIKEMNYAYGAADLIISRAGALSISELCIVGKPIILIPSPNVSEDHQTKNAMALVHADAAILVKDNESRSVLSQTIFDTLEDKSKLQKLSKNIKTLAKPEATNTIVQSIENILNKS